MLNFIDFKSQSHIKSILIKRKTFKINELVAKYKNLAVQCNKDVNFKQDKQIDFVSFGISLFASYYCILVKESYLYSIMILKKCCKFIFNDLTITHCINSVHF